jgi:hypothetical protein
VRAARCVVAQGVPVERGGSVAVVDEELECSGVVGRDRSCRLVRRGGGVVHAGGLGVDAVERTF